MATDQRVRQTGARVDDRISRCEQRSLVRSIGSFVIQTLRFPSCPTEQRVDAERRFPKGTVTSVGRVNRVFLRRDSTRRVIRLSVVTRHRRYHFLGETLYTGVFRVSKETRRRLVLLLREGRSLRLVLFAIPRHSRFLTELRRRAVFHEAYVFRRSDSSLSSHLGAGRPHFIRSR